MKQARYIPAQMHCHSFIELFYVVRGECIHVCGDKKYLLRAGDFCFWQFDLPHYIQADSDDCIAVNILIQKPAFRSYFFGMLTENNLFNDYFNKILYGEGDSPMILFRTGDDRRLCALVCAMYREYEQKGDYWKTLLCSYLNYLFVYLLREHQGHLISSQEQGCFDPTLEILEYIQEHYDTITLNELCQKFNYSEAYLSRLIKKKSGKTFTQLVHTQRLHHAAWLLENTDRSVGEIAMEVHYADTSHFCREFTKNYGVSPGNYRKNRQNDSDRDAV
jgi:AraC-like DNA-binding protein